MTITRISFLVQHDGDIMDAKAVRDIFILPGRAKALNAIKAMKAARLTDGSWDEVAVQDAMRIIALTLGAEANLTIEQAQEDTVFEERLPFEKAVTDPTPA